MPQDLQVRTDLHPIDQVSDYDIDERTSRVMHTILTVSFDLVGQAGDQNCCSVSAQSGDEFVYPIDSVGAVSGREVLI